MVKRSLAYLGQFEKNLWILSGGWFVGSLGFAISIPFISIYFHAELGLSIGQIGVFFGVMAIVRSIFQAIGGEMSDHVERRTILIHSQIYRSIAFVFLALSIYLHWGFWAIAASLLVNSIFGAVYQPVANAVVTDILPQAKRLDGYAITRSAGNLGWAAGPAIGGFLAGHSYGLLFVMSAVITLTSGLIFLFFLRVKRTGSAGSRFRLSDLLAIKNDRNLARHSLLIFCLYLVVAQLMAPFSVYAVEMVKISEYQLGLLYTLNGLMVVLLQIPVTHMLARFKFTSQLALGGIAYAIGYGMMGIWVGFNHFVVAMVIVTLGEILMSPPSLALTSKLAPDGKMGRYMGIFGLFVTSGWSFGPLYGGLILDHFGNDFALSWILISSLAAVSAAGYLAFARKLPAHLNIKT